MQSFRTLANSKAGKYLAAGILLLIMAAFAVTGMNGQGGLGALGTNSTSVATVDGQSISVNDLQSRTQQIFERAREQQPQLTMAQFLAEGGVKLVADQLIQQKALVAYGDKHGMQVSKKLVDAEIARVPSFADATGAFSESQFKAILAQQHLTEKQVREDLANQILRQHILLAAGAGGRPPESFVAPYAAMLIEARTGEVLAIPSKVFAPTQPASEAELKAFYTAHPRDFALPEQRKLRYILFSSNRFDAQTAPTDADIAAAYKARASFYAPRETRDVSQLILPTEAQAKDIAAKAAGGKKLADLAREAGLSPAPFKGQDQTQLAVQTSADIAKAAFAAKKGALLGPFKAPLGWALVSVDDTHTIPGKTLDQAKSEIVSLLRADKGRELFANFANQIDAKLRGGAKLDDVAKAEGAEVVETPFLTAQGVNVHDATYKPDETVTAVLKAGFSMTPGDDPQIAQLKVDEQIAVVAPGDVIAAGPPPFAEARPAVEADWSLAQGAVKARDAANKVVGLLKQGATIDDALKQTGVVGQPRQPVTVRRVDLQQQQGRVPPPVQALFAMTQGSAKVMPMDKNQGFVVVTLQKITQTDPQTDPVSLQSARAGLAQAVGGEYAAQFAAAILKDVKVTRNAAAIASVEAELRKANVSAQ